jgi:hypothetical protein
MCRNIAQSIRTDESDLGRPQEWGDFVTIPRQAVVACARSFIGTPYQHQQRMKGVAVDCAGLVIGVARELKLVAPDFDVNGYTRQPDGSMLDWCDRFMTPVRRDQLAPGHVVAIAFDADPQHVGIVGERRYGHLTIIHSASALRCVVEHRLLWHAKMRYVGSWALPGVESLASSLLAGRY